MIVFQIPKKSRIELNADGWWVFIKNDSYQFNSLAECLCYLAGRQLITYEQIDYLIHAARKRFE